MQNTSNRRWIRAIGGSLIALSGSASADAGYQDTTQITGGALVRMFRSIPFMPKSAMQVLDPMVTNVELHGNQLARVSKISSEIIDLDQETVTRTDNDKNTYTVTTFDEMRRAFKDAAKKSGRRRATRMNPPRVRNRGASRSTRSPLMSPSWTPAHPKPSTVCSRRNKS